MKLNLNGTALQVTVLATSLAFTLAAAAQQPAATPAPDNAPFDVGQLFASTCGFCHSDGGRAAGRGPQLMNSARDDDFLRNRIKTGKNGAMPAFGASFSDAQIDEIVKYIRALKPHEG
jgi:mono/diheme cytochrome c family protein